MAERIKKIQKVLSAGPSITDAEVKLVTEAVREGWYEGMNMHMDPFIQEFNAYVGVEDCLPVSNCTAALHLAMLGLNLGPGDEVIVPDLTWVASAAPITYVGAEPVFADIDPKSWCLSPQAFEKAITPRTKAVVVVDTYGNMAEWDEIGSIAREHGITTIEDAAEAFGAEYKGKKAGSLGDIGCFSLNVTKMMMAGQGGVITAKDPEVMIKARRLAGHGMIPYNEKTFWSTEIGYNYRWSNLQAALGLAQLRRIDELLEIKEKHFKWYQSRLGGIPEIQMNEVPPGTKSSLWMVNTILGGRYRIPKETVMQGMKELGIDTRPLFYPVSSQPAYAAYTEGKDYEAKNPVSYDVSRFGISLPYALRLTEDEVDYVCRALLQVLEDNTANAIN